MDLLENRLANFCFADLLITMFLYWGNMAFNKSSLLSFYDKPIIRYSSTIDSDKLTSDSVSTINYQSSKKYSISDIANIGILLLHLALTLLLGIRWYISGHFPVSNLYESLYFLTWGIASLHLYLTLTTDLKWVGIITSPICLLVVAFASLVLPEDMQISSPLVPALQSNWLFMHVTIIMASYASLSIGGLFCMGSIVSGIISLNLGKEDEPKYMKDGITEIKVFFSRLADQMDQLGYRTISLGFPLLTIGIVAGAVWANEAWGSYWNWDPKETAALISWLVFVIYFHNRISKYNEIDNVEITNNVSVLEETLITRQSSFIGALGFIMIWVCYIGINLLAQGLHSYGWFL